MSTSSEQDDNFLRIHAKAIAEALQQQDEAAKSGPAPKNQSQREQMTHDAYVALCHDDPRVESDLACQYLATALLDPKSKYALSGPLVEGIRQLCTKQQEQQSSKGDNPSTTENNNLTTIHASTPKGSAMLAWAIYARIPLLCCQAKKLDDIHAYLGSYRPPPPPNPLPLQEETKKSSALHSLEKNEEADRLAELLSQPPEEEDSKDNNKPEDDSPLVEDEVWAAESDPSDFEFDSGFTYEQQITDFQDTFAAWMMDRSDPFKLSKPPTEGTTTWKHVRHAVMDLTSQLNYRQIASLWNSEGNTTTNNSLNGAARGPADLLTQFTMTLLVPPTISTSTGPSIFDSPDDEQDAMEPQRQLQAMAWYPLWVLRDAAANASSITPFSRYLTLLQTLISVDAAASSKTSKPSKTMAPAAYVGLASLSALCQKFVLEADTATTITRTSQTVERFRALRLSLWETSDDMSHALEQEERLAKTGNDKGSDWIVWTLLPMFEILTNQRLQTGTTIVAKAESMAQRHHQQTSQHWSGLLQSGCFRQWLMRLQALGEKEEEKSMLWHWMRRSLLYTIAQSLSATSALGKYAWRFPKFASVVEIGEEAPKTSTDSDLSSFSERLVDDVLWHLLSMELAGGASAAGPTIQWKSSAKKTTPLPTREECQRYSWEGFQKLCSSVVHVLDLACQEENKKENLAITSETKNDSPAITGEGADKAQYQVVLQSFHRFVNSVVACPVLAKLFVNDLEMTSDETKTISKCLDTIQESLSQYKAPAPDTSKSSLKAKDEDGEGKMEEVLPTKAKEDAQDASLQEDIHTVRKVLKVLRSLLSSKSASSGGALAPLDVTSSSKTD